MDTMQREMKLSQEGTMGNVRPKKGISGSTIKMIAIISMLIDHIAATVLERMLANSELSMMTNSNPEQLMQYIQENPNIVVLSLVYFVMRLIGRLGFPLFCFLLIEGYKHTRNVWKYAARLGVFALVSEIPFDLAFKSRVLEFSYQNVFFTLFLGLLAMIIFDMVFKKDWHKVVKIILGILTIAAFMVAAQILKTDYAAIGIFSIMILFLFRNHKVGQIIAGCIVFLWEITAPLAFLPVGFYNGERGWNMKYVFYAFYPLHLFLLFLISVLMGLVQNFSFF